MLIFLTFIADSKPILQSKLFTFVSFKKQSITISSYWLRNVIFFKLKKNNLQNNQSIHSYKDKQVYIYTSFLYLSETRRKMFLIWIIGVCVCFFFFISSTEPIWHRIFSCILITRMGIVFGYGHIYVFDWKISIL